MPVIRHHFSIKRQTAQESIQKTTGLLHLGGLWRRRRDSNSRDAFDAYAISSRAPSTKLGDFSIFNWRIVPLPINAGRSSLTSHQRRLLYHKTGCASITFFQFRCIFCSGRAELSAPPGRCRISNIAFQARQAGWDGRGPGCCKCVCVSAAADCTMPWNICGRICCEQEQVIRYPPSRSSFIARRLISL